MQGVGCRVWGAGCRVQGLVGCVLCRVYGVTFTKASVGAKASVVVVGRHLGFRRDLLELLHLLTLIPGGPLGLGFRSLGFGWGVACTL